MTKIYKCLWCRTILASGTFALGTPCPHCHKTLIITEDS